MEQLTEEELKTLINIVSQVQVPVAQATPYIQLINKMSRMIDQHQIKITEEEIEEAPEK